MTEVNELIILFFVLLNTSLALPGTSGVGAVVGVPAVFVDMAALLLTMLLLLLLFPTPPEEEDLADEVDEDDVCDSS